MNDGLFPGVGIGQYGVVQRFAYSYITSSQTIHPPPWAKFASILCVGAGGGGGGGRLGVSTNASGGAGGGGGGSRYVYRMPLQFPRLEAERFVVTIGSGGTAGIGATVDGNNGGNGGSGGSTHVTYNWWSGDANTPRTQIRITCNAGSGGSGGQTGNPLGAAGGFADYYGNYGMLGGDGAFSATAGGTPSRYPTSNSYNQALYFVSGGGGGSGKNSNYQTHPSAPNLFGFPYPIAGVVGFSVDGINAVETGRQPFFYGLQNLTRAPFPFELWFISFSGPQGGTGADTTTGNVGGKGGNGWNGTGGAGGGGAGGTAGSAGGNGGTGGNGYILFFWEEK